MTRILAAAVAAILLAGCQAAHATADNDAADAKAFLTGIYSNYQTSNEDFTPLETPGDYFDPAMVALILQDQKQNDGDVGAFEVDPMCNCQDYGKITADIKILDVTATTAKAGVVLSDTMAPGERSIAYDLVKIAGHWRIHDIGYGADYPSLRQHIIDTDKTN